MTVQNKWINLSKQHLSWPFCFVNCRLATSSKKIKGDHCRDQFLEGRTIQIEEEGEKAGQREESWGQECPTQDELSKIIWLEWNPYVAAKTLLCILFSQSKNLMHSVSGKAPNSRVKAKPKFDSRKYSIFTDIIKEKFPTLQTKDVTSKY